MNVQHDTPLPSQPPTAPAVAPTPLQQALSTNLRHPAIVHFPHTPLPMIRRASAISNRGLDHVGNENLVAIAHEKLEDKQGNVVVLTDRRLFGCSGQSLFSVGYSGVAGVRRRADILGPRLRIQTGADARDALEIDASLASALVEPLLAALSTMPEEQRAVERAPLATSRDDDPIGARQIKSKLLWPDAHTQAGVAFLEKAHARGWLDVDAAMNALKRLLISNRTHFMGRGMWSGAWISPCAVQDLAHGFVSLFGRPVWQGSEGSAIFLEFRRAAERFPKAYDESLSLRASARQHVDHVRVTIAPVDQLGSSFRFEEKIYDDKLEPVALRNVRLWQAVETALLPYETQVTQLRTVLGWQMHAAELLAHGPLMAPQRIAEMHAAS